MAKNAKAADMGGLDRIGRREADREMYRRAQASKRATRWGYTSPNQPKRGEQK